MKVINLTQHGATPDQKQVGVVDLPDDLRQDLRNLLTFEEVPSVQEIISRAEKLAHLAGVALTLAGVPFGGSAMIGGAPYLMGPLALALKRRGIEPLYAFSTRESVEEASPDGTVHKRTVFRHAGWVPAAPALWCEECGSGIDDQAPCKRCLEEDCV